MIHSMTAYASRTGALGATSWMWEMRGVNARGLDLRLRLPDAVDGVEAAVRKAFTAGLSRGNISLSLRLTRDDDAAPMSLDQDQLDRVLQALDAVQERAFAMGVTLGQPTAADVLNQRGVFTPGARAEEDMTGLQAALMADISPLLADFVAMRAGEGANLGAVIGNQLDEIEKLTKSAAIAAEARRPEVQAQLHAAMQRVLAEMTEPDEARIAQELAVLAIKSDVTEEIDRLQSHVGAARALLESPKPAGRKLDFLTQEFNREANTLCAKAQSSPLTAIGLDLKAVIDQMREQIQNVE